MMLPAREDDPYIGWRPPFPEPAIAPGKAALLIVDMQRQCGHRDGATLRKMRAAGANRRGKFLGDCICGRSGPRLACSDSLKIATCASAPALGRP
jgi:hypothetical protein